MLKTKPVEDLNQLAQILFRPMGAEGLYARTGLYETVVDALSVMISRHRHPKAEVFRFPPVMSRAMIEKAGYLKSFPNLLGCVSCLGGGEAGVGRTVSRLAAGREWTEDLAAADLVLTPACCYPLYPIAAERGRTPGQGLIFDVACECFRREPSKDLDRLQSFRMREFVAIGEPAMVRAFRGDWIERAKGMADRLGLAWTIALASDPFFGRGGPLMAASQIEQSLKFELLAPILADGRPTACMSFNYHREHFGETWELLGEDGAVSHTGCVAFGMDRLAIALFATHGADISRWPGSVRGALEL